MPLKSFICPDGKTRPITKCLEKCPRKEGRCLSLPTLHDLGKTREWTGKPSTTQLLNPTRLEYLRITKPFDVDPFEQAFMLLGTRHHQRLESVAKKIEGLKSEMPLGGEVSGILDLLEPINSTETYRLIDYKTYGSYPVAKLIGAKEHGENDTAKLELQLNNYRLMASELGFNITELWAQITVRDGGTFTARNNKVDFKLLLLPVKILEDKFVRGYFSNKAKALQKALETGETELCDFEGRWGGRRCKGFCPVVKYCPEGAMVNKIKLEK